MKTEELRKIALAEVVDFILPKVVANPRFLFTGPQDQH
jgi:hypothetical protein